MWLTRNRKLASQLPCLCVLVQFVRKADCALHFCIDCKKSNFFKVKNYYSRLSLNKCTDALEDAQVHLTLYAYWIYKQILVKKASEKMTVFACNHASYQFINMSFSLRNTSATFQTVKDVILSAGRLQHTLFYLEDIVLFTKRLLHLIDQTRLVLFVVKDSAITLKFTECTFFASRIEHIEHIYIYNKWEVA